MYAPSLSCKGLERSKRGTMADTGAIICVPSAIPAAERHKHFALAREIFTQRALELEELPNGYAVRFAQDALEAVARFVSNERLCCPFLQFELRVESGDGPLWLQMIGPPGTPAMLRAELGLSASCGCHR